MLTVGMNGTGKTVFNRTLLSSVVNQRPIAILDSKPDDYLLLPGSLVIQSVTDIRKWKQDRNPVLVYRPNIQELLHPIAMDNWLQSMYDIGDVLVYIDELSALQQRHVQRPGLINLLARGRARNRDGRVVHSPLWMSSQRPRAIPVQSYTEAWRIVVFELGGDKDRVEVSKDTHEDLRKPPSKRYGFRLFDRRLRLSLDCEPIRIGS